MPLTDVNYTISDPPTAEDNAVLDTLSDIIINGVESGYIDYWALTLDYQWNGNEDEHDEYPDTKGRKVTANVLLREHNESSDPADMGEPQDVTPQTLLIAALRLVNGEVVGYNHGYDKPLSQRLLDLLRDPLHGFHDFDAEDADILIQIAALGELRYG